MGRVENKPVSLIPEGAVWVLLKRLIHVRIRRVIAAQVKTANIVQNTVLERRETFRVYVIAVIPNA